MVRFGPKVHHRPFDAAQGRRSIRLKGYDYSQAGAYFVTIVTWQREFLFGEIVDKEMRLNKIGKIVEWEWLELSKRLHYVELGASVVMPNHFHGILFIHESVGATRQGQRMSQPGVELTQTVTPHSRPYYYPVGQNPHHLAQSLHNSNPVLQNEYGKSPNLTTHPSGSAIITSM